MFLIRKFNNLIDLAKLFLTCKISQKRITINSIRDVKLGKYTKLQYDSKGLISFLGKFSCRRFVTISSNGGEIVIGDDVFINNYSSMTSRGKIKIGNNTLIGESVKIYDHDHIFNQQALIKNQGFKVGIVNIGSNVWIGSNVTILRGTTIGNNCVVGAGCVLKGNYPDGSLIKSTIGTNCQESIVTYEEITS